MSDFLDDIAAEGKRQLIQGSMEIANLLFNGSAFVPYGPGQYTPSQDIEPLQQGKNVETPQIENDGMER